MIDSSTIVNRDLFMRQNDWLETILVLVYSLDGSDIYSIPHYQDYAAFQQTWHRPRRNDNTITPRSVGLLC